MPDFCNNGFGALSKSSLLARHGIKRVFFNPEDPTHIASLKNYMENGTWLQQFYPEEPFIDVPGTVFNKFIRHQLGVSVAGSHINQETKSIFANAKIVPLRNDTTNIHAQPEQFDSGEDAASRTTQKATR